MKPRRATYTLIIILVLIAIFILLKRQEPGQREAFDRHPSHLYYTPHALCRMDCRHITRDDIHEIMDHGIINFYKSHRDDRPCPSFALQGETEDGKKLRVIFAQCSDETKVVTCYNLKEDPDCYCPGDEKKN